MTTQLPNGSNFLLKVESGFTVKAYELMTDTGNHQLLSSTGTRFSLCEKDENGVDRRPVVTSDGVRNGCYVSPTASGAANAFDLSPGTLLIGGALVNITGSLGVSVSRPSAGNYRIVSVTLTAVGGLVVVNGADGTVVCATRGAAGGPPWVPTGSIELATIILSGTAGPLAEESITFAPEYSHAPEYTLLPYSATVRFAAPLAAIHTGATIRAVWAKWSEPTMVSLDAIAFRPPVVIHEIDPITTRPVARRIKPGLVTWVLSGNGADLNRKMAFGPRLYQFQSDAAQTRMDLFFAHAELSVDYRPIVIVEGTALLFPVEFPVVI